jgi:hypothetical protein
MCRSCAAWTRANLSEQREGEQGKNPQEEVSSVEERISARDRIKQRERERKNREGREIELPNNLCAILENCRDLSVKHEFHINLKP